MKTKSEHGLEKNPQPSYKQSGNALIYVLIAIVLFAALSFTFARRNAGETMAQVSQAKAESYATELIGYAAQVKSVIDQLTITGTQINDLDFTLPAEAGFNAEPQMHKIYHPSGGGLMPLLLNKDVVQKDLTNPPAGVYLGMFNTVEWTPSAANDVILTAYGISKVVCETINDKITGDRLIPPVAGELAEYLVNAAYHASNADFVESACPDCKNKLMLCVSDSNAEIFAFYTVIVAR